MMEPKERARDPQVVKERGRFLISTPTPTPTHSSRSPDQPCKVRKGYGKMGPEGSGGKELDPSRWEKTS